MLCDLWADCEGTQSLSSVSDGILTLHIQQKVPSELCPVHGAEYIIT